MLQRFKRDGIHNVSFIIVNSVHPMSQRMISLLQKRVSFPVYQEREGESFWEILEGGKDDMFVYDRCGRLAYYIPFPLSLIYSKGSIVRAAILSTYFEEPCGVSCSSESSLFMDTLEQQQNVTTENDTEELIVDLNLSENNAQNTTEGQQVSEDADINMEYVQRNGTDLASDSIVNSTSLPGKAWDISKFMHNNGRGQHHSRAHHQDKVENDTQNETQQEVGHVDKTTAEIAFDDERCPGLKVEDCNDFTRDELEKAQHCCTNVLLAGRMHNSHAHDHDHDNSNRHRHHLRHRQIRGECQHLSRRKCKKLQPFLKCCLRNTGQSPKPQDRDTEVTTPAMREKDTKI